MTDHTTPPTKPAFLRAMDFVLNNISRLCLLIAGVAIVVLTVIYVWLVFTRYVLNDTATWVEQASLLLVMAIAFLGAAVGTQQDTHISVSIFRAIVPTKIRTVFVIVADLLMLIFGASMFWYGWILTSFKWTTQIPLLHVSEGFRSLPLTICGALVFLFSLGHLIRLFMGLDERKDSIE